jgi:hypothetical protein
MRQVHVAGERMFVDYAATTLEVVDGTTGEVRVDEIERPALRTLPVEPYLYAEWKECRVGLDYHVEVERHYYSVPHTLLRETV